MKESSDQGVNAAPRQGATGADVADPATFRHRLTDGSEILIRPLTSGDTALERDFLERLSPESREFRFLGQLKATDRVVAQLTSVDPTRDAALIAVVVEAARTPRAIGVGRFSAEGTTRRAECAVVVSDDWQRKGVATLLMNHLIAIARERGLLALYSIDVADNPGMRALARRLGFERSTYTEYPGEVVHSLQL